ncbi:MAG: type II secretion system protein [Phycisphaerae bacterium]|nr:type II secretion system protein [Phycisphaerae bacterium]
MIGQTPGTLRAVKAAKNTNGGPRCREIVPRPAAGAGRGFTLIELLVVIAIIAVLTGILAPAIAMVRELARQATCGTNLRSIGTGLAIYAESKGEGAYPYMPLNGAGWGVEIGTGRIVDGDRGAGQSRNPSATLYLLVREGTCKAEAFVCPSSGERAGTSGDYWDFRSGLNISYSLMMPYGPKRYFEDTSESVILLADSSPYFDPSTGLRNSVAPVNLNGADDEEAKAGNSPNHKGLGQNVTQAGGSTRFVERADVGVDGDNIYTRAARQTDPGGTVPVGGGDVGPAGPRDTFLVP